MRETLGLEYRGVQLQFVGVRTAEIDGPGHRDPCRRCVLREHDRRQAVGPEVGAGREHLPEVAGRRVVLIERRDIQNEIHRLEDARQAAGLL